MKKEQGRRFPERERKRRFLDMDDEEWDRMMGKLWTMLVSITLSVLAAIIIAKLR